MKNMAKRTKKATTTDGFGNQVQSETLTFKQMYDDWETDCRKYSSADIQSEGKKGKTTPPNLLEQVKEHVTLAYRRPNSKNKGGTGAHVVIDKILESLKSEKLFLAKEEEELKKFQKELRKLNKKGSSLNPSNIVFNRPEDYDVVDGKVVNESKVQIPIYGHYVDKYFVDKYPEKKYTVKESWSDTSKNVSNPPLKQALFGKGDLITVGLADVVDKAIEELDNKKINLYTIGIKRASALARIPSVQSWVRRNIVKKKFYPENSGKINLTEIGNALLIEEFTIRNEIEQKMLTIAATNKNIEFAQEIEAFKVGQISNGVMATLIREVISRGKTENIKVKNGYYLQLRGLSDPPSETWKEIKKSWMQHLWA
tara:strand:+ start:387 stop:1493 length:1107 start_codon:yes stop_codon:yes gene_type:complete